MVSFTGTAGDPVILRWAGNNGEIVNTKGEVSEIAEVVDTDALVEALQNKTIAAAGLDVVYPEPLPEDHPLWTMDNVFITITDQSGAVVQKLNMVATRGGLKQIDLQTFSADYPLRVQGSLDPDTLAPGQYRCTLVVRLGTEEEVTVRDFTFTR